MTDALIVRALCAIRPGKYDDALAFTARMRLEAPHRPGIVVYRHFAGPSADTLFGFCVYADEQAYLDHAATLDPQALAEVLEVRQIQVHGPVSLALRERLAATANVQLFPDL